MGLRYLDSKSFVRRIMNLDTRPPSSLSRFSLSSLALSVASASRPRIIAFSKFFRKSFLLPRKLGLAKLRREKYSDKSFCGMRALASLEISKTRGMQYLNWCSREDNPPFHIKPVQRLECLRLCQIVSTGSTT